MEVYTNRGSSHARISEVFNSSYPPTIEEPLKTDALSIRLSSLKKGAEAQTDALLFNRKNHNSFKHKKGCPLLKIFQL